MAVMLSALRADRPLLQERFILLISVVAESTQGAKVRLEWLSQLKNPMASTGIEPATCRLVA
jgi:hypothetical protein